MKNDPRIRNALDESLSSVHFDARDMHRVLRAVREQEAPVRQSARRKRRPLRLDFLFAVATAALVIVPLSLFALRAQRAATSKITTVAAHGAQSAVSTEKPDGREDVLLATPLPLSTAAPSTAGAMDEYDAIQAARACFEAQCDTSIFTFDEYAVDVSAASGEDGAPSSYVVTMQSIYGNGCVFRVVVSAQDGAVISYSTPRLATVPAALDRQCAEVQAWYDRYGAHSFTWPLDAQAEFSRRYEGGMRRMPEEGEMDADAIAAAAQDIFAAQAGSNAEACGSLCLSLYGERAFADGVARYQVYCLPQSDTGELPESCTVLTLRASDGVLESSQILPVPSF